MMPVQACVLKTCAASLLLHVRDVCQNRYNVIGNANSACILFPRYLPIKESFDIVNMIYLPIK